jgi:hypothetical protein
VKVGRVHVEPAPVPCAHPGAREYVRLAVAAASGCDSAGYRVNRDRQWEAGRVVVLDMRQQVLCFGRHRHDVKILPQQHDPG